MLWRKLLPRHRESVPSFDTTATIQETVLYEENGVKITATGLECSLSQVALDLTIENNSSQDLSLLQCHTGGIAAMLSMGSWWMTVM